MKSSEIKGLTDIIKLLLAFKIVINHISNVNNGEIIKEEKQLEATEQRKKQNEHTDKHFVTINMLIKKGKPLSSLCLIHIFCSCQNQYLWLFQWFVSNASEYLWVLWFIP